jgi:hypothetical protein
MEMSSIIEFVSQLEGPYKWYVLGGVLVVLTALVTRFIFKTLKWFLMIVAAAIIVFTIVNYFVDIELPVAAEEEKKSPTATK